MDLVFTGRETQIYIQEQLFTQCKYLLLNIPVTETHKTFEINSIDEAKPLYSHEHELTKTEIDPETEFMGHCSNLQAWYEYDYDTNLLDMKLAFPLLKRLTEVGDPLAKKVFKEEIAKRIESGYLPVIQYLVDEGYLEYLNEEEIETLLTEVSSSYLRILLEKKKWEKESTLHLDNSLIPYCRFYINEEGSWDVYFPSTDTGLKTIEEKYKEHKGSEPLSLIYFDPHRWIVYEDLRKIIEKYKKLKEKYQICMKCNQIIPKNMSSILTEQGDHICSICLFECEDNKIIKVKKILGPEEERRRLERDIISHNQIANVMREHRKLTQGNLFLSIILTILFSLLLGFSILSRDLIMILAVNLFDLVLLLLFFTYIGRFSDKVMGEIYKKYFKIRELELEDE